MFSALKESRTVSSVPNGLDFVRGASPLRFIRPVMKRRLMQSRVGASTPRRHFLPRRHFPV